MKIFVSAGLLCLFALGGCNIGSMARVNPNTVASYGVPDPGRNAKPLIGAKTNGGCPFTRGLDDTTNGALNLDCFTFPGEEMPAYQQASSLDANGSESGAIYARNRLTAVLMKHADDVCVLEKGRIVGREGALNFGLGTATTALSTVASLVGGEVTKSILAGGAAFTSSTRAHAAESFYRNQVTQAINAAMDGEREKVRADIEAGRAKGLGDFTVDDMIRQVNRYHQACSYERGLQLLVKAAVNQEGLNSIAANRDAVAKRANMILERSVAQTELASATDSTRKKYLEERITKLNGAIDADMGVSAENKPAAPAAPAVPAVPAAPDAPAAPGGSGSN